MDGLKKAYAWREALELSKRLVGVCEEFSDTDTNVLVWHLRQAVVDIPAGIAADLQDGRPAAMEPVVRLATELELVGKIYPAIDISAAEEQLERLMERMQDAGRFAEREPEPEAEAETGGDENDRDNDEQPVEDAAPTPQVDGVQQAVPVNPQEG